MARGEWANKDAIMTTKLSEHFTLEELTVTQVRDVDNTPRSGAVIGALKHTAEVMESVRTLLGAKQIIVTSGYRSPLVNKAVGGSLVSAHMTGHAVDFICPGFGSPEAVAVAIRDSDIRFDQLIYEETWVHISFAPALRGEVLTKRRHGSYVSGIRGDSQHG